MSGRTSALDFLTPRRLVTAALLLLAFVAIVVGFQRTVTTNRTTACSVPNTPVLQLLPCPGDSDLRQGTIGVDMAAGWQVDLYVDNTPIPRDAMTIEGGLQYFTPRPGTVTGALAPGNHTARIVYYQNLANEAQGVQHTWAFSTH
jgi:hypothetical protein